MKIHQILTENTRESELYAAIEDMCRNIKPYVHAVKDHGGVGENRLYRGIKNFDDMIKLVKVRKDRRPLNTPIPIHQLACDFFERKFGSPVRSEAAFVSGSAAQASEYGNTVCVIPKGEFRAIWSPIVHDLTVTFDSMFEETVYYQHHLKEQGSRKSDASASYKRWSSIWAEENPDEIKNAFAHLGYREGDLIDAIESRNEVALICDEIYLIDEYILDDYADVIDIKAVR